MLRGKRISREKRTKKIKVKQGGSKKVKGQRQRQRQLGKIRKAVTKEKVKRQWGKIRKAVTKEKVKRQWGKIRETKNELIKSAKDRYNKNMRIRKEGRTKTRSSRPPLPPPQPPQQQPPQQQQQPPQQQQQPPQQEQQPPQQQLAPQQEQQLEQQQQEQQQLAPQQEQQQEQQQLAPQQQEQQLEQQQLAPQQEQLAPQQQQQQLEPPQQEQEQEQQPPQQEQQQQKEQQETQEKPPQHQQKSPQDYCKKVPVCSDIMDKNSPHIIAIGGLTHLKIKTRDDNYKEGLFIRAEDPLFGDEKIIIKEGELEKEYPVKEGHNMEKFVVDDKEIYIYWGDNVKENIEVISSDSKTNKGNSDNFVKKENKVDTKREQKNDVVAAAAAAIMNAVINRKGLAGT